jgi:hypothetical protein
MCKHRTERCCKQGADNIKTNHAVKYYFSFTSKDIIKRRDNYLQQLIWRARFMHEAYIQ